MLKYCQKIYLKTIYAKLLISNQLSVAYKLFLYKILVKTATEAHRNDGSAAVRGRGGLKFRHYWTSSGAPVSFA